MADKYQNGMDSQYHFGINADVPKKSLSDKSPSEDVGEPEPLTPAAFLALRDDWLDYVNQCPALKHATTRVGTFIALRMNASEQASWWPVNRIAEAVGCSTRTVSDAIAELQQENLLVVSRPDRRTNQRYFIRLPYGFETQKLRD